LEPARGRPRRTWLRPRPLARRQGGADAVRHGWVRRSGEDPAKHLPTEETAKAAAEAELAKSQRAQKGVDLTMPGRPETLGQTPFTVLGLRDEMFGDWITETAEHTADFEGAGFASKITGHRTADVKKGP